MKWYLPLLLTAALSACVTTPTAPQEDIDDGIRPLLCKGAEQCSVYWRRAQVWVARNSAMKIQTATDAMIETFNPQPNTQQRGYRVLRMPQEDGAERIMISSGCAGYLPCSSNEISMAARFKRFVLTGRE